MDESTGQEVFRGERGRFKPGHHMGRPNRGNILWETVKSIGRHPDEVRSMIVRKLLEAADKGEDWAVKMCGDRMLPPARTLGELGLFTNCKTPADYQAAVLGALAAGAIAPVEAANINTAVRAYSEAVEWHAVREAVAGLAAAGVRGLPGLPRPPDAVAVPNVDPLS